MRSRIKLFEARARIGKTDAAAARIAQNAFQSGAGIAHAQSQTFACATHADLDGAGRALGFDPVLDGVFNQRLQDERWHVSSSRGRLDRYLDAQAFPETGL